MIEQLSLLAPTESTPVAGAERFAECRARVAAGCGGHHEPRGMWMLWHCCYGCPNCAELNPWAAE